MEGAWNEVVVLDIGTQTLKGGCAVNFPSDEEPRLITPTAVTVESSGRSDGSGETGPTKIHHPVLAGEVQAWDQIESLLYSCLYDSLGWQLGSEGCVVVSEPVLTCKADREALTQLMFEVFNVAGIFFQDQATLSLYAVGKTSGCVVDLGHGKADISTVLEGQLCTSSALRLPLGGHALTNLLGDLLKKDGVTHAPTDAAGLEALKHMCTAAADHAGETVQDRQVKAAAATASSAAAASNGATTNSNNDSSSKESGKVPGLPCTYTLPDGQEICITTQGLQVAEALFRPEAIAGIQCPGLAESVIDSINLTAFEGNYRRVALENILVCGGGSSIPNVGQRLCKELNMLTHPSLSPSLCPVPEYLPKGSVPQWAPWVGGAVLGKVLLTQSQFMTKWDYEESGPAAVHRRCL